MRGGAFVERGGTRFRVWAPRCRTIAVEVSERVVPLVAIGGGWYEAFVGGTGIGARYLYVLDGERRRPDPCSRYQPEGVHGHSEVVDPQVFVWRHDAAPRPTLRDAIFYELHVGTFSSAGTFVGVVGRLGDIEASGANVVELMPVAAFPGDRGWGYDGVSWLAPHAAYGGPEALRALVDRCHERRLAVVLDVVCNHLGPEGNYLSEFGPYFSDRATTPWGSPLDLDGPSSGPIRAFVIEALRALVEEFHLDGVRLDAVHAFVDRSPIHIVAEMGAALKADASARGRTLWIISESDLGDTRVVEPVEGGGWGSDAMWSDDFHHALHAAVTGERNGHYADFGSLEQVARALERGFVHTGRPLVYRRGPFGMPAAFLDGHRFLVSIQNHDQVGNRSHGERLASLVPGAEWALATALLTSPFLPLLFMGEEYGESAPFPYFTAFGDGALGRAVREGRRRDVGPGGPDPDERATFESARLDATCRGEPGAALRRWYRRLADLRRDRASLGPGPLGLTEAMVDGRALVVRRSGRLEETLVVYSLGPSSSSVTLPAPRRGAWRVLADAAFFGGPTGLGWDDTKLHLPPWAAIVLGAP